MPEPIILKDTAGNEIYKSSTARTVKEAVEELAQATPYNQMIENLDLRGADLRGINLAFVHNLRNPNFSGADLTDANLVGASFGKNAQFERSTLINVNMTRATFDGSLNGATISNVIFDKSSYIPDQIRYALPITLRDVDGNKIYTASKEAITIKDALIEALNNKTDLKRINLPNADLSHIDLRGVDLRNSNLSGANLTGSKLDGANLEGSVAMSTDFTNTSLDKSDLRDVNLSDSTLHGTSLNDAKFYRTNFENADIDGVSFQNHQLDNAKNIPLDVERQEDVIKTHSTVDSLIMQSSTRPSEAQIEVSKQADIDVDATYEQVDNGTVPSEVLIQAQSIKGFETLSKAQQFVVKVAIQIANKVLAKVDQNLRNDIKRNFETNYEKAISNGTLNIPPEIQQHVDKRMEQERPKVPETQQIKERNYKVPEKEMVM
ncbi:pentapeptide repeat-containing protein [Pelistega sp. MC2]|uniref:pentapeptide repeat-containing protein n=1 Tax=Pelistega sp. MC2 TaxID=1720297 RepID=UPI0008D9FBFA|nr:pentapeptide repeat-containing protein [Pelistega sp. MC2]